METLILTLFICFTLPITSLGQVIKANSFVKANKTTYSVITLKKFAGEKYEFNSIFNKNNLFHGKNPKVGINALLLDGKIPKKSFYIAFTQTFTKERLQELTKERIIYFTLFFNPEGKVVEVEFLILNNSSLTALELERLETALKQYVVYNVGDVLSKGVDFFQDTYIVSYRGVLDNTL